MRVFKSTYNINKISNGEFLAYTHLGLGDHIVCNGLINYFSELYKKIYLPVKSRDISNIKYLYKDNPKVEVFKIEHESEVNDINSFAKKMNLQILKVGFKKRKPPFNKSFYDQFHIPYKFSFEKFYVSRDLEKEDKLLVHLKNNYKVKGPYQLIHNQSSYGKVVLNTGNDLPKIYVDKETDIYRNIFFYIKVIEFATEIHCLDSSFLHLVERIQTNATLFFHDIKQAGQKGAEVYLEKEWNVINYFD